MIGRTYSISSACAQRSAACSVADMTSDGLDPQRNASSAAADMNRWCARARGSVCVQQEPVRGGLADTAGLQYSRSGGMAARAKARQRSRLRVHRWGKLPLRVSSLRLPHLLDGAAHDERPLIFVGDRG